MDVSEPSSLSRGRLIVSVVLACGLAIAGLQIALVRPYLWPAGAGVTLSGDTTLAALAEPRSTPRMRPPHVPPATTVSITRVNEVLGTGVRSLAVGTVVTGIYDHDGKHLDLSGGLPNDAAGVLRVWRDAYGMRTDRPLALRVQDGSGDARIVTLERVSAWRSGSATRTAWLDQHGGSLLQLTAFLAGALALVALGTRGMTARLMTLALISAAVATGGPLYGVERMVPLVGTILLFLTWIATPLSFPIIGLATLHFPNRAPILDRHRWIYPALAMATAPMLVISVLAAAFLLGMDGILPALAWLVSNGWTFDLSFAVALAANLLIMVEGVRRYRANRDANERRRIQIVVYTGVGAVLAYTITNIIPALSSITGRPVQLPWLLQWTLQAIILLPAFALPYAVAVKRVFSPRTVLRQGLQYALARRTLSILVALPVAALVFALVRQRNQPLGAIILGQPLFYVLCTALAGVGFRYRDAAQRWLDQRFFRAEYDGREILVSLANRVPYETDPAQLVSLVIAQIDSALHPESVAVLAGDGDRLEVISPRGHDVGVLPRDGALATLLRWSEEPLEIFLDDDRSPAARLPAVDRAWLAASGLSLLVPILAGSGDQRALAGLIGLGEKRSEEPYTPEDRRLLSAIAAQMSVALDLSRLRRRLSSGSVAVAAASVAPTTHSLAGFNRMPAVIDDKYRVDAEIGRGGMGAVFRAHDLRLGRDVAIKVVRTDLVAHADARIRFAREAQIVAKLQHPAIVTVFDFGTLPDGAAYLVMEYVRGQDLRSVLKQEGSLNLERTVALVGSLAAGIDFAHRAGVLHRDLKPENVLLPDNGIGPKVLDFGVAKMTDTAAGDERQTLTQGGTVIGTPAYMAPEQLRGETVDGRADVYSLAVLTFETLTGRLPFGGGSVVEVGIKQAGAHMSLEGVPPGLVPALVSALSLSPDDRPATAAAFATSLLLPSSPRS